MGLNLTDMVEPHIVAILVDRIENNSEMELGEFRNLIEQIDELSPENIEVTKLKKEIVLTEVELLNDRGMLLVPVGVEPKTKISFGKLRRLNNLKSKLDTLLIKEKIG